MRILLFGPPRLADFLRGAGHEVFELHANDLAVQAAKEFGPEAVLYFDQFDQAEGAVVPHEDALKALAAGGHRVVLAAPRESPLVPFAGALGVRDFVFLPAGPEEILHRLENPATPQEAAEALRGLALGAPEGRVLRTVLLAAGRGGEAERIRSELAARGVEVRACRYREQLPGLVRASGAGVVILSPALPGAVSLADLIQAVAGAARVVFMPGAKNDPRAVEAAREAARLGVKDIAWDASRAVELVFRPAVEADIPEEPAFGGPEGEPEAAVDPGRVMRRGLISRLFSLFAGRRDPLPLPAEVRPVRAAVSPPAPAAVPRVAVLGLPADFPTVPVEEAQVVISAAETAAEAKRRAPAGAKVYLAGEGLFTWRLALQLGITPVAPDEIRELFVPAVVPELRLPMKCLLVYSSKTSVGKTSISVTAAVLLARRGRKVCLVDLDGGGRTATWLFLGDRAVSGERFYPTRWGVDVICLPDETEAYNRLAAHALSHYDAVVVDCPGRLQMPRAAEAFLGTARIFLVSSCTSASVAAVREFTDRRMAEYGIGGRTVLVVNRAEKLPPLQPGDVRRLVGFEPAGELPYDPLVDRMFSARTPLPGIKAKKKPFEGAVAELLQKHLSEVCSSYE